VTSMFSTNDNRKNSFEGEITLLSTLAASNGGYELTNGFLGMLSR